MDGLFSGVCNMMLVLILIDRTVKKTGLVNKWLENVIDRSSLHGN